MRRRRARASWWRSIRRRAATKHSAACGLVAAGRAGDLVYVLADETVTGLSPAGWASKAIALWRRLEADCLVVEVNQGGDMVRAVIREADASVPVTPVRAHRGKISARRAGGGSSTSRAA